MLMEFLMQNAHLVQMLITKNISLFLHYEFIGIEQYYTSFTIIILLVTIKHSSCSSNRISKCQNSGGISKYGDEKFFILT